MTYYFANSFEAENTLMKLQDIANKKGYATLADMRDTHEGDRIYPEDYLIGWSPEMLRKIYINHPTNDLYSICLPDPILIENIDNYETPETSPEPIFITIHANELDVYDPDEIISSVLNRVEKIKDRTVNIAIM